MKKIDLTWKDIRLIEEIMDEIVDYEYFETFIRLSEQEYYTEVLRRFNEQRNGENKESNR